MELSINDLRELIGEKSTGGPKLAIGDKVFIRTLSYHYVGRVVEVRGSWIELDDASWVADSGRWSNALRTGKLTEVEPYLNTVWVNLDCAVDVCGWAHDLPREVK